MTRAEIIKKIRYILQSGQCPSYFTNKCKNDGACGRCENEALDRLIAEHDAQIRVDERIKAEQDFQNSDYWNDYLGKVIADARADERREISEILNSPGDAETTVMMLTNYMVRHTIRDALKNRGAEE